jgi:hypothetical protein
VRLGFFIVAPIVRRAKTGSALSASAESPIMGLEQPIDLGVRQRSKSLIYEFTT